MAPPVGAPGPRLVLPEHLQRPLDAQHLDVQLPDGQTLSVDLAAMRAMPKSMQERAMGALQDLERQLLWNPMQRYVPASCRNPDGSPRHPAGEHDARCKHHIFHLGARSHPLAAFLGGNRSGKTTTTLADDIIQMTPRELLPPRLHAYKKWECPFYCRVMTPDMQRTMVPVVYQKLRDWLPKDLLKRGNFDRSFDKQAASLRLECGCRFDFLSYEMDLDKFGGAALHRCHFDEQPPKDIRLECLMRLIDYGGDELYSLTPLKGMGWLYRDVWKQRHSNPNVFAIRVGIDENPTLDATTRERVAATVTDDKDAAVRLEGKFMADSGLVYPGYDKRFVEARDRDWVRSCENVVAIDPGIRYAGFAYVAFDQRNESHTWRAVKHENFIAEDYVREIRTALARVGLGLDDVDIVIDPKSAAQRNLVSGTTIQDELADLGLYVIYADNAKEVGVRQIRRRIRFGWLSILDPEQPDEFLGMATVELTDELEELAMDTEADDEGEFKTVKIKDHVADAWRYAHMHRQWMPELAHGPEPERGVAWWEKASGPTGEQLRAIRHVDEQLDGGGAMGAMA